MNLVLSNPDDAGAGALTNGSITHKKGLLSAMKTRRLNKLFSLGALALFMCMPAFSQTPQQLPEQDDAFHYQQWQGTPYAGAYTEWWYFNLYDKKNDLQGIVSYQVVDPQNLTGHGVSFVSAVAYKGSDIVNCYDVYPLADFSASYTAADVKIGPNTISVPGPNTYQVNGAASNGRLSWNLVYERESDSWYAADHVNVAPASWEQMNWLLYMPRAHVSGTLTVDGKSYNVESAGYHDHNWGEWDFANVRWNWAEFSKPGLTFDLGDFIDDPNGKAAIDIAGDRIVFPASEYTLEHTKWAYDPKNKINYPTESVFTASVSTADHGTVQVEVTMDIQKTDALPVIPGLIIYEQPTYFTGKVVTHEGEGSNESTIDFKGSGFKEYTGAVSTVTN